MDVDPGHLLARRKTSISGCLFAVDSSDNWQGRSARMTKLFGIPKKKPPLVLSEDLSCGKEKDLDNARPIRAARMLLGVSKWEMRSFLPGCCPLDGLDGAAPVYACGDETKTRCGCCVPARLWLSLTNACVLDAMSASFRGVCLHSRCVGLASFGGCGDTSGLLDAVIHGAMLSQRCE